MAQMKRRRFLPPFWRRDRNVVALIMIKFFQNLGHKSWPSNSLYKTRGLFKSYVYCNSLDFLVLAFELLLSSLRASSNMSFRAFCFHHL